MLLHEGVTQIHSQIKPRLHFGESFTLMLFSGCPLTVITNPQRCFAAKPQLQNTGWAVSR